MEIKPDKKAESPERSRRVVVAMSGGVDSSVAAALLKKQGFDVTGVFMRFWKDGKSFDNRCCSVESERLAELVAKQIGIPFYVLDAEKEFKKKVVDYFLKEYKKGDTPNPCVVCNKEIKFGLLIKKALAFGADFVATGHYARISLGNQIFFDRAPLRVRRASKNLLPRLKLLKGRDENKDQSYFLWQLNRVQLSHVLFPVGDYTKPEVRKLAKKFKLLTAETPESQEICFVQKDTNDFLRKYLKSNPGKITDKSGKILGEHHGLWFYTIGQRKGLEINQGPYYAIEKDFKNNILVVSKDEKDLLKKEFTVCDVNWISPVDLPITAEVKIRYRSVLAKAKILDAGENKLKIIFQKPQQSITPGQSAVFYRGAEVLGGGIIE